jgi:hypothetical protein
MIGSMKAVVFREHGGPERLEIAEVRYQQWPRPVFWLKFGLAR